MSLSSCKAFNTPYVTMQLRVAESDGVVKQHTVEMTIPQFQVNLPTWMSCTSSVQWRACGSESN